MVVDAVPLGNVSKGERSATLAQVQEETLPLVLPVLAVAGVLLVTSAAAQPDPLWGMGLGLMLFGTIAVTLMVRRRQHQVAACLLVGGLAATALACAAWMRVEAAVLLLALPAGLAFLLMGPVGGILAGLACTLLLWIVPGEIPALRLVAVVGIWGGVGLLWLAVRPLTVASPLSERRRALARGQRPPDPSLAVPDRSR